MSIDIRIIVHGYPYKHAKILMSCGHINHLLFTLVAQLSWPIRLRDIKGKAATFKCE